MTDTRPRTIRRQARTRPGGRMLAIAAAEWVERGVFRWLTSPERRAAAGHGARPVPARHYRRGP